MLHSSSLPNLFSHKIFSHIHSLPTLFSSFFYSFKLFVSKPVVLNSSHILLLISGYKSFPFISYSSSPSFYFSPYSSLFHSYILYQSSVYLYLDNLLWISAFIRRLIKINLSIVFVSHINHHLHLFSSYIVHKLILNPSKFKRICI